MIEASAPFLPTGWRAMRFDDLPYVHALADRIHFDHPERLDVFVAKFAVYPTGCFVIDGDLPGIRGYAIAHPYVLGRIPNLDAVIEALPQQSNCIYLHDIAIEIGERGKGRTAQVIEALRRIAHTTGFANIALTALPGRSVFWKERFGFREYESRIDRKSLANYGTGSNYLICTA